MKKFKKIFLWAFIFSYIAILMPITAKALICIPVNQGGTGACTFTAGLLKANGKNPFTTATPGTDYLNTVTTDGININGNGTSIPIYLSDPIIDGIRVNAIDIANRTFDDTSGNVSGDFDRRTLKDSSGTNKFTWDPLAFPTLTSNGFLKTSAGNGTIIVDTNTYLTANQTITLSGEATGSGATAITVTLSNAAIIGKVLTGYSSGAGTISATDSLLSAIQKLNGNIGALVTGVSSVSGTTNRITATPTTGAVVVDISASYVGQSSITTVGTLTNLTVTNAPTFSAMTAKSVLFAGTAGLLAQDNSSFQYDSSTHRLSIGTTASTSTLTLGGQTSWTTALGAIRHILGPQDQNLLIEGAGNATTSTIGRGISLIGGDTASGNGGGNIILTAGTNTQNTGGLTGGSVLITAGGAGGAENGGSVTITTNPSGQAGAGAVNVGTVNMPGMGPGLFAGALNLTTGSATSSGNGNGGVWTGTTGSGFGAGKGGAMNLTLGNGGAIGGLGGDYLLLSGNGGANNAGNGGRAGGIDINGQVGGSSSFATGTGGQGGGIGISPGIGGASSGATTATGGNAGGFSFTGRAGGATSGTGTQVGGNGTSLTFLSGGGGNAGGSAGSRTGGNSGSETFTIGAVGTGATANGILGTFNFVGSKTLFAAATTNYGSINLASGTAPTSPVNGDIWYDGTHIQGRVAGTTYPLDASLGVWFPYVAKTANYTVTLADYEIDCTANTFTVTLPNSAAGNTQIFVVTNSGAGIITVTTVGATQIVGNNGISTTATVAAGSSTTFHSTGAGYRIN